MRTRNISQYTANPPNDGFPLKEKYKYLEFKYLYFKAQKLVNKKVQLSLKYDQLKAPEIHSTLIKPITTKLIEFSSISHLHLVLSRYIPPPNVASPFQTPRFGPQYNTTGSSAQKTSMNIIYVLLLLRYEYLIQSENNLIQYELLTTKASLCEILAIRMLREYKSAERINSLFINPMKMHSSLTKKDTKFNTLELAVLSKSKKFLSQPIIVQILNRFYNGELIIKDYNDNGITDYDPQSILDCSVADQDFLEEQNLLNKTDENNIVNYKFNTISIKMVNNRSNIVPKYQSLVINLKHIALTMLYFILIMSNKKNGDMATETSSVPFRPVIEGLFWSLALSFNFEHLIKFSNIEFQFLKKIIWTYVDIILITLIDITFILKVLHYFDRVPLKLYYSFFSLISIILFPRILSAFNNYKFFNTVLLSFQKMLYNMVGMFCLFIACIFGFYLSFINLTNLRSYYDIAFDMLKLFFGFTPAVWNNWNSYSNLGKTVQLAYLFLIQFIISTIFAICLGQVFVKLNQSSNEEFEYIKTINLIIYLKWGSIFHLDYMKARTSSRKSKRTRTIQFVNNILKVFKVPIILIIFFYECLVKNSRIYSKTTSTSLKQFTFLNRDTDYYGDKDILIMLRSSRNMVDPDDTEQSILIPKSRKGSAFTNKVKSQFSRRFSQVEGNTNFVNTPTNSNFGLYNLRGGAGSVGNGNYLGPANPVPTKNNALVQVQSISTLGNFRSASTDSLFIDQMLSKKYGATSSSGSGGTIVQDKPVFSESVLKTPMGPPGQYSGDRIISHLNIGLEEPYKKAMPKRAKRTFKKRSKNDEILLKLNALEALLFNMTEAHDESIDKMDKSNEMPFLEVAEFYEEKINSDLLEEDFEGECTDTNTVEYNSGGNMYNIAEVSLDDMNLIGMSDQEPGNDSDSEYATEVYESDETF